MEMVGDLVATFRVNDTPNIIGLGGPHETGFCLR